MSKTSPSISVLYWFRLVRPLGPLISLSREVMTRPKHLGGLGFRDIEIFNLCLLARQSWRILQNPASLSARLLKAIYFPNTSILEAELGTHPSQIWRSVLAGRDVLT